MRLRALLLVGPLLIAMPVAAQRASLSVPAGQAFAHETLSIGNAPTGPTAAKLVAPNGQPASYAEASVDTASLRCTFDGTAPSGSVGHLYYPGDRFPIVGSRQLQVLKCYATGVAGMLALTYYSVP